MNNGRKIYIDYQASTPVDLSISEAMQDVSVKCFANPHANDHAFGWEAASIIDNSARTIAARLGCDPDEIVFTSGATEASNLAVLGLAERAEGVRRRILVSAVEHKCVLAAADAARRRFGCSVDLIPVDANGLVRLDVLEERLREDVLLVSIMAVNNEIGTLQPMREISALCRSAGAIFHTDAAQAWSAGPLTVETTGADLISISGHKIYGPKGIGALYVRRNLQPSIEPQIVGGDQQRGLRSGTLPVPLCAGLAAAAELMATPSADEERRRVASIRDRFAHNMLQHNSVRLVGPDLAHRHPGNCSLLFEGSNGADILSRIQPRVAASTGSACTSGTPEPSHVLRAIGLSSAEAESCIRFSFGRFSTETDADDASAILEAALNEREEQEPLPDAV